MVLAVEFPKSVKIENTRLAIMYYVLALVAIAVVVIEIVNEKTYLKIYKPSGKVSFWVDSQTWDTVTDSEIQAVNAADGSLPVCQTPERFEYCDMPDCSGSSWKKFACQDVCTSTQTSNCADKTERWFKEDSGIFFPTYFNDTMLIMQQEGRIVKSKQRILKGTEEMVLSFDHQYRVDQTGGQILASGNNKDQTGSGLLLTVLLDNEKDENGQYLNNEVERWEPGVAVSISVKKMLDLAGLDLDTVREDYGANFFPGAEFSHGVLARIAGAEIEVDLQYTNEQTKFTMDWWGPVCYMRIRPAVAWTSKPMLSILDPEGSQRLRYYQGIRVKFKSGGMYGVISFGQILNGLTSCLVFLGAAKKLTIIFAMTCLGALSRIYKRFITQDASFEKDACGLAARMTAHTSAFMELKDTKAGVSKDRIVRRFERIFAQEAELNKAEIKRFAEYVYDRLTPSGGDSVNVQEYARATALGEQVDVKSLIEIFDADRKKFFLEKMFMDESVRALIKSDAEFKSDNGSWEKGMEVKQEQKEKNATNGNPDLEANGKVPALTLPAKPEEPGQKQQKSLTPSLTSTQLAANQNDDDEGDLLEILQQTEASLKQHTLELEQNQRQLQDVVSLHERKIGHLSGDITYVQGDMQKVRHTIEEMQKELEQDEQKALDVVQPHLQAMEENCVSKVDAVHKLHEQHRAALDKLLQQSNQMQSDMENLKLARRTSSPMVVEETTRRVIQGSTNQSPHVPTTDPVQTDSTNVAHQHRILATESKGTSSERTDRPCGIPSAWELCGDRPHDAHEVKNLHRV